MAVILSIPASRIHLDPHPAAARGAPSHPARKYSLCTTGQFKVVATDCSRYSRGTVERSISVFVDIADRTARRPYPWWISLEEQIFIQVMTPKRHFQTHCIEKTCISICRPIQDMLLCCQAKTLKLIPRAVSSCLVCKNRVAARSYRLQLPGCIPYFVLIGSICCPRQSGGSRIR